MKFSIFTLSLFFVFFNRVSASEKDKIEIFYNQAWNLLESDPDSAIILAEQMKELSEKHKDSDGLHKAYYVLGTANYLTNEYDKASDSFIRGLTLLEGKNSKKSLRKKLFFLQSLGNIYDQVENHEISMYYYNMALEIAVETHNEESYAEILYNIALTIYKSGEYKDARNLFFKALDYFEKQDNLLYAAKAMNSIGNTYNKEGQLDKALDYYERAITKVKGIPEYKGELALYTSNLGENAKKRGNYELAEILYDEAIQICRFAHLEKEGARIEANMGDLKMILKDTAAANWHYTNTILLCDTSVYNPVLDRCLLNLVNNNIAKNNLKDLKYNSAIMASQYDELSYLLRYLKLQHQRYAVKVTMLEFQEEQNQVYIEKLLRNITVFQVLVVLAALTLIIGVVKYVVFLRRRQQLYDNFKNGL